MASSRTAGLLPKVAAGGERWDCSCLPAGELWRGRALLLDRVIFPDCSSPRELLSITFYLVIVLNFQEWQKNLNKKTPRLKVI